MKLQIKHKHIASQQIAAVFVRSNNVNVWLNTIQQLGISLEQLVCYPLPSSIQSNNVAGLFIMLPAGLQIPNELLLERYIKMGDKLFIPFNSVLYPAVEVKELNELLLWNVQVFHPSIGLIGFEKKDGINLTGLLEALVLNNNDWSYANAGLSQRPAFTKVLVHQPAIEEMMQSLKETIDTKPLEEIPGNDNNNFLSAVSDKLKWLFFKAAFSLTGLPCALFNFNNNNQASAGKPGPMNELRQWLQQNISDLEKKRSSELNRLLKMFDENTDEALQYAIPLDSPYLNRGNAVKTSSLTKRSLNFDLLKLGGGYAVDGWDVSEHYNNLRTKYLKAAEKEINEKDFRKAAYIYAHLLGDFSAAANVLEQGKFYRESAAIHRDHFKNKKAAAQCFERGGLYSEAIPIYEELQEYEKTGDLFGLLNQKNNTNDFYQKALDIKVGGSDYLDAARISHEKMNDVDAAQKLLFNGWNSSHQSEQCLDKYFQLIFSHNEDELQTKVSDIYQHHTPVSKRLQFLNALNKVNQKTGGTNNTYTEFAYEIISNEASAGNMLPLHNLKQFIQKDQLLSNDCSRYANSGKLKKVHARSSHLMHLDQSIKWIKAVPHRNQFIAIGVRDSLLHMARANWYGNTEYYTWTASVKSATRFSFTLSQFYSRHIILQASDGFLISHKSLKKNKYFNDAISVHCPVWLHKDQGQFVINDKEELCKIEVQDNKITIHYYSVHGDIKRSVNCKTAKDSFFGSTPSTPATVIYKEHFYTNRDKQFIIISEKGAVTTYPFDTIIRIFAASNEFAKLNIIISTNKGCILCKPEKYALNVVTDFFAPKLTPSSIVFIAENKFLVIEKKKAVLFFIDDDNVDLIKEFFAEDLIVAALPSNRNEFGLLEQNGRITVFTIS